MKRILHVLAIACLAWTTVVSAQSVQSQPTSARKVLTQVAPEYPGIAKRMNIRGAVKLEVAVRPNGSVKSCRVLGGNPVLLESATKAVSQWKFAPSQNETMEVIQITFAPQDN